MESAAPLQDIRLLTSPAYCFSDPELRYVGLVEDDYAHGRLLTLNYQAKGLNFVVKSKGTLDLKGTHFSKPNPKTSSQVKFITNVSGREVEARFDSRGAIRLWGNIGTYDLGLPVNLVGKVKTNTRFNTLSYSSIAELKYQNFNIWDGGHLFLNQKVILSDRNIQAGIVYKLSLATFLLSRVNLFSTYRYGNTHFYLDHVVSGRGLAKLDSWGKTTLAVSWRTKQLEHVVKATFSPDKGIAPVKFVYGTKAKLDKNTVVKAKIDHKTNFAVTGKYTVSRNLTVLAGTQVRLSEPSSFSTTTVVPVPLGINLKLSYT